MKHALHEESYEGIFIYMRGSQLETIEVVHEFKNGKEFERLTSLSGELREIIRQDGKSVCYHANSDHIDLSHDLPLGPFSHSFTENLTANQSMYRITQHGKGRIAGRTAIKIAINPLDNRYGYELWLDEETGLLLRSNLVNRGRVLELFQFSQVTIGDEIQSSQLVSSLPENATRHLLTQPDQEIAQTQVKKDWRVSWIPNGFRPVRAPAANGLAFTDGIATLSIFVERIVERGGRKSPLGDTQNLVGATVVITRQIKGSSQQITVVGEVPMAMAKRVADSIEPVIY